MLPSREVGPVRSLAPWQDRAVRSEDEVTGGPIRPGEGGEATTSGAGTDHAVETDLVAGEVAQHTTGAVMLSFGAVHPGRERLAVEMFTEVSRFLGEVLADGVIESFKPFFYDGGTVGDTTGFFLLEGQREALDGLRRRRDFQRLVLRAGAATAYVRVHALVAGTEAGRMVNFYRSVREELGLLSPVTSEPGT